MRAWGLAKGLQTNGVDITVGINNSFPQEISEHDGIKIINWSPDKQFAELINTYDAIIISYCMGSESVFVADNINDDVLLILDAYVPIYVEVSARNSDDMGNELRNYLEDIKRFNHVLKRGDYFLCANQTQKVFYTGILGSLGVVNPRSYSQDRILVVPFGIHNEPIGAPKNPYLELGIKEKDRVILWFGGLYPWFRVEDYLDAILKLSKSDPSMRFVFVGGKNPFNNNPDLLRQYEKTVEFAEKNNLKDKVMFFVDWVDFDTRAKWYKYADFVISLNQPGGENAFSWRTRVMDYVWGEVVTFTNGGDPLGEDLIRDKAAIKLNNLSSDEIASTITHIYKNPKELTSAQKVLQDIKPRYFWENITKILYEKIIEDSLPYRDEILFKKKHAITAATIEAVPMSSPPNKLKRAAKVPSKLIRHAREKGVKRSAKLATSIVRNQLKSRSAPRGKEFVFISHPIDNTGAPLVMLQIIDEVRDKYGAKNIRVLAPYVTANNRKALAEKGIRLQKSAHALSPRMTGLHLSLKRDDFVLLNTAAIYDNYRGYVFNLLDSGRLEHAYWFIHEDIAQLKVVAPQLMKDEHINKIHKLAKAGKLTILVPSKRVAEDYGKLFDLENIAVVPLHVSVDEHYKTPRTEKDYSSINFMLSGTPSDGRKGQLIALPAFQKFITTYFRDNPSQYRDFTLHFVGIGDDYVSTQIKSVGKAILSDRLHIHPTVPRSEALEITHKCNAVICCSLNETFALYVAEGMAMGHIVLRNNSAGVDEQLSQGKNGFYINSDDINQFADVIEKILNKKSLPDNKLQQMGAKSQEIIEAYSNNSYLQYLDL